MADVEIVHKILAEVRKASTTENRAYLLGASRDGTFNRLHRTLRISQADVRWLQLLQVVFHRIGSQSWIYREGSRGVWVIESTCRLTDIDLSAPHVQIAFIRGYFDAEGGVPHQAQARFYIQFVQKNRIDLDRLRTMLVYSGIQCGKVHNPSARVAPDYWRFYVLSSFHQRFISRGGSWHPRKRGRLRIRLETQTI